MLQRLRLRDFQVHENLDLVLDPHITCIIGASDVGKSAILRALRWVMTNQPAGDAFVRHGADVAFVELTVDGRIVTRRRGKSENVYLFDKETYKSFGAAAVPDTLARFLNVGPVNFQGQLDPPFWFLETAPQLSRNLNAIVNLGEIDEILATAAFEVRKAKSVVDLTEERLKAARAKRDELEWVMDMDDQLFELEKLGKDWTEEQQSVEYLDGLIAHIETGEGQLAELKTCCLEGSALLGRAEAVRRATAERENLERLLTDIETAEAALDEDPSAEFDELRDLRTQADEAAEDRRVLDSLLTEIDKLEDELCRLSEELRNVEEELRKSSGNRCPVCGNPFDPSLSLCPTSTSHTDAPSPGGRETRTGIKRRKAT